MMDAMKTRKIRVFVVDDHAIVRDGIQSLLATEPDIEWVGEAANGADAVSKVRILHPDVILMDLVMPEMDGIDAICQIMAFQPEARILVLTSFSVDDKVFPAIKAGALGYLLKDTGSEDLMRAIHQVSRGESSLHPKIARMLLQEIATAQPSRNIESPQKFSGQSTVIDPLTERELEVLKLVAHGCTNREIADRLIVAEGTVRTHVSNILDKLHLASRTQATLYALREGLASLEDVDEDC
jgi:two-component system, NarL family, response regulator LiaR